jgi:fermentation-respiration switch protein FrsA (DUF1100 family)
MTMGPPQRRPKHMLWSIIIVPLSIYLAFTAAVWVLQPKLLYFPERNHDATPEAIGLSYESVFFKTADGVKIHGWYIPAERSRGAILFCHGNAGNISHRLFFIDLLNRMGMSTLIFDYRGYGWSEGKPSEEGTYRDAEAAWDYLVSEKRFNPREIVILGRSIGGSIAARTARDCKPAALIVESVFTSVRDIGSEVYPYLPVRWLSRYDYNTLEFLRRVSCPVLVIHSPQDEIIPIHHGKHLYEAANPPREFLEIKGSHNEGAVISGRFYTDGIDSFIARYVKP